MMKYLLFAVLSLGIWSCADTEEPVANADAPTELPEIAALSEEQRKQHLEEYGIDIYRGIPTGLNIGESAPVFKAKDQTNKDVFLPDLYKDGPVVVVFYRGQWCPACNKHLAALEDSLALINSYGAKLIAISPETKQGIEQTVSKTKATYPVIADPDGYIMSAFKLNFFVTQTYQEKTSQKLGANIAANNGTQEARLPIPATYIIGTDGKIKYKYFNPDYHQRASVQDIITELKKLQQPAS